PCRQSIQGPKRLAAESFDQFFEALARTSSGAAGSRRIESGLDACMQSLQAVIVLHPDEAPTHPPDLLESSHAEGGGGAKLVSLRLSLFGNPALELDWLLELLLISIPNYFDHSFDRFFDNAVDLPNAIEILIELLFHDLLLPS